MEKELQHQSPIRVLDEDDVFGGIPAPQMQQDLGYTPDEMQLISRAMEIMDKKKREQAQKVQEVRQQKEALELAQSLKKPASATPASNKSAGRGRGRGKKR